MRNFYTYVSNEDKQNKKSFGQYNARWYLMIRESAFRQKGVYANRVRISLPKWQDIRTEFAYERVSGHSKGRQCNQ